MKFFIAGCTATSVDIFVYFALTYWVGLWYITSSISSFVIAFWVSFGLQKFWTFRDKNTEKLMTQTYLYFLLPLLIWESALC